MSAFENPASPVILSRVDEHVAVITLNRPTKRNAIDGEMTKLLAAVDHEVESNPDIWAAVLTSSSPKVFCAGADLSEVAAGRQGALATPEGGFAGFVRITKSKPWIAAMDGHALAGGLEIALACHLRVAGKEALFGLPEARVGMLAGAGGVDRLPRLIPMAIALEMLCTAAPISADRAFAIGLVNSVVPTGEALNAALELARKICRNSPLSVRGSLKFAQLVAELPASELIRQMSVEQARIYASNDCREGALAFVEKREPQWTGA